MRGAASADPPTRLNVDERFSHAGSTYLTDTLGSFGLGSKLDQLDRFRTGSCYCESGRRTVKSAKPVIDVERYRAVPHAASCTPLAAPPRPHAPQAGVVAD